MTDGAIPDLLGVIFVFQIEDSIRSCRPLAARMVVTACLVRYVTWLDVMMRFLWC